MRFSTDCGDLADRQIVIEAVIENEDEKTSVFGRLDKVVDDPQAILASNTSSIPIMKLGMATSRPAQVVGIHFFIPVPVLKLVERYVGQGWKPGPPRPPGKAPPHHFKRPEKLVRILPRLIEKDPDVFLLFVGPDGGSSRRSRSWGRVSV